LTSENPALGKLIGKFMIIGDTVLSSYISENGIYSGTESLFKIDESTYLNRGFAFNGKTSFHHGKSNWNVSSLVEFVYSGGTAVKSGLKEQNWRMQN